MFLFSLKLEWTFHICPDLIEAVGRTQMLLVYSNVSNFT